MLSHTWLVIMLALSTSPNSLISSCANTCHALGLFPITCGTKSFAICRKTYWITSSSHPHLISLMDFNPNDSMSLCKQN